MDVSSFANVCGQPGTGEGRLAFVVHRNDGCVGVVPTFREV